MKFTCSKGATLCSSDGIHTHHDNGIITINEADDENEVNTYYNQRHAAYLQEDNTICSSFLLCKH